MRLGMLLIIVLLVGCASAPEIKPIIVRPEPPLIKYALSLQGVPYRWGKETPKEGFDCSGFVQHVYGRHGIKLPRTAHEMATTLPPIPMNDLRMGDLIFFNTRAGKKYSHVGIFLKNNRFIHAPNRRIGKVLVSSLSGYWRDHLVGARRPRKH